MKTNRDIDKTIQRNIWRKVMTLVIGVAVALAVLFYIFELGGAAITNGADITTHTAFQGGTHEASGVTQIPGTDAVLFVDDGRPGEVFWLPLDEQGKQTGSIKAIPLGVSTEDPEGITNDGTYFYLVGSLSKKNGAQADIVRFKLNASNQTAEAVETVSGLKDFLTTNVAELRGLDTQKSKTAGINIEGLAWDFPNNRLLLGLRNPLVEGNALVVALQLRDAQRKFATDNLIVAGSKAIRLPLGGLGIRGIEFDTGAKAFRIIAGAMEGSEKTDFKLYEWSGESDAAKPRAVKTIDRNLQPEGVARIAVKGREFTFLVFDSSGYAKVE